MIRQVMKAAKVAATAAVLLKVSEAAAKAVDRAWDKYATRQ
jgi:hypothetical protein